MALYDLTIYTPLAGVLYAEGETTPTGGAELQMTLLAGALARRGLSVCHVVSYSAPLPQRVNGLDLVVEPPRATGDSRMRTIHRTLGCLMKADAHVYLQRGVSYETGLVGGYARLRKRAFVFSVASRFALPPAVHPSSLTKVAYQFGLRTASEIVTQTEEQSRDVARILGRRAILIRSIAQPAAPTATPRAFFLWIGAMIDFKDPLVFLELAERVPEADFVMVVRDVGRDWAALASEITRRASRLANLTVEAARPRAALAPLYEGAVAVVNTSTFEGFPNIFLEGWSRGALTLSLNVDPDGVIERYGLGACAHGSIDVLANGARAMWGRRNDDGSQRRSAAHYVATHHDIDVVGEQWLGLARSLLPRERAAAISAE